MNILIKDNKYTVSGDVTLKECMNLSVLMRQASNIKADIEALKVSEDNGEFRVYKESAEKTGDKGIADYIGTPAFSTINMCIKGFYRLIYNALHDDFVFDKGNKSAALAQENAFRQSIILALQTMLKCKATIQLCTVLDSDDKLYPKAGIVKGFKLYNSFNTVLDIEADYENIISKADFVLTVESK